MLCECFVRVLYKKRICLFPRYHTDAIYGGYKIRRLQPNLKFRHTSIDGSWEFVTNSQGYRSCRDFNYEKTQDRVIRVICLGDSHTLGFEVRQDYTYSSVLERYLHTQGYDAEVFNTGISGFGTAEELVFLENEGVKYRPDYVILGFFENDFEDNIKSDLFNLCDGQLHEKNKEHIPGVRIQNAIFKIPFTCYLSENSYFYSMLLNSGWEYFKKRLYSKRKAQLLTESAISSEELSDYRIDLASELIKHTYAFCQKNGITFIVLDIPRPEPRPDGRRFASSIPDKMRQFVIDNSDIFIDSEQVLGDYNGITEIHNPNGQHHISEFTHVILGINIGKEIITREENL